MLTEILLDKRITLRDADSIIKIPNVIYINGDFTEEVSKAFYDEFDSALASNQEIIPIVINSYGGDPYTLLSMVDLINSVDVTIATIGIGKVMSAGAFLLSCGDEGYRFAGPSCSIMIHGVSDDHLEGKMSDLKVDVREGEKLEQRLFEMMSINCGQDKAYFSKLYTKNKNSDIYLTPKEAKKHNLINHIKIPKLVTTMSVETELV